MRTDIRVNDTGGYTPYVLQETIGAYSDEAYTNARKLSGTDIVQGDPDIDTDGETYIGQMRWFTPLNPVVNVASLTDATNGTPTTYGSQFLQYVKSARTHGAEKVNLSKIVTQDDGLAKVGRDLGETRAQDEHDAILAILKGVAISELMYGAAQATGASGLGGQSFSNDPSDNAYGFYVDLGASKVVTDAAAANIGAQRAAGFLNAFGQAYKDHEPEYAYLVASPAVMASLRSANLVDSDRVTDGNVEFNTIFQGKFRLIQTRATQSLTAAERAMFAATSVASEGVDIVGTLTSYIVLPGALAMEPLTIDEDVEIERAAAAYQGGGTTQIWYRWGYILHPAGYNWAGSQDAFPTNANYQQITDGTTPVAVDSIGAATVNGLDGFTGVWQRKTSSALSLGILPVFHS
ncbi:MAG: hypothetical protein OEX12_00105 [Gammaproteobacteria bacterium]|nr:hypothetical protein [Gammaproteobacteria bacterium]